MATLAIHINFDGQCEAAFTYYETHLGGKIGHLMRNSEAPGAKSLDPHWQTKITHANITVGNVSIAGGDVKPEQYQKPLGFNLLLGLTTPQQVEEKFEILRQQGEVILPPQTTFWSPRYAIVVDQFQVPWKLNCGG